MILNYSTACIQSYIRNSRGVQQFSCRWLPFSSPKALVFLCHGYGTECGGFMREIGIRLAGAGYAVFGIDYEGHGRSFGARCYIKKFEYIVKDCHDYFKSVCAEEEFRGKGRFLYGESMGGAVALLVHKKNPTFYNGAILVAPMCKISEKVKPHPVVINILTSFEEIIPKWKIVPTKDVIDSAFKDPVKREMIRNNKLIYQDKPRLKTALEMLRTSMSLEHTLHEVTFPFFVLHGKADTVTDPEISKALYERASSKDKMIKLYTGMWHGLTSGEPEENIALVFADIIAWLDKHTGEGSAIEVQPVEDDTDMLRTKPASPTKVDIIERLATSASPAKKGTYFCGLNGRRLLHLSAM
ncbi:caffeoylshikimate esterase isoform X2 [Tripterygium wilfordii]|uniref:Caffeoylshikimate esterase isoform X2 n=1 Tax=Tripterygium wilfordii TaxID=458696 RepID=A0A7J7CBG9_TRIWF|nr:caffeoylshikimate esterase isoform X2 [Tripterygium wilfordii]